MTFKPIRLEKRFPEAHGFVLLDPARLDAFCNGRAEGADLLTRFSQTEDGDRVSREGIAIPITELDEGDYTIVLREAGSPGVNALLRVRSPGWVLGTETGKLVFCGIGYLLHWNPLHPNHAQIQIPPGWYQVEVLGYILNEGTRMEDWLYEFVVTHSEHKPLFTADLSASLSLFPE